MQRRCDAPGCRKTYEAKRATSKYCSDTCRKRASRGQTAKPDKPPAAEVVVDTPAPLSTTLVPAIEKQLREAGRLDTWLGQQAVLIAQVLAAGDGTSAGLAGISRELREAMTAALRGAGGTKSAVTRRREELAARKKTAAKAKPKRT